MRVLVEHGKEVCLVTGSLISKETFTGTSFLEGSGLVHMAHPPHALADALELFLVGRHLPSEHIQNSIPLFS